MDDDIEFSKLIDSDTDSDTSLVELGDVSDLSGDEFLNDEMLDLQNEELRADERVAEKLHLQIDKKKPGNARVRYQKALDIYFSCAVRH